MTFWKSANTATATLLMASACQTPGTEGSPARLVSAHRTPLTNHRCSASLESAGLRRGRGWSGAGVDQRLAHRVDA
jgi:hypothetical protein